MVSAEQRVGGVLPRQWIVAQWIADPVFSTIASGRPVQIELGRDQLCAIVEGTISMAVPNGAEVARPFLPTRDFDKSRAFYEALGFEKLLDGDVAIFAVGKTSFILTRQWAENCMMQLMVDDLDAWWAHIQKLDLPHAFGVDPPRPPAMQPWGLRVAYVVDPAGILWHVAQRRKDKPAD